MRFAKIDQKLKHVKQKFNQSIDELITHIEKLKTQLSEFSEKYQKYSNLLHALHSHFRKTMLRNYFDIFFRKKLKKLIRRFEHIKILFDEKKIRDFNSSKVRKSRFFYRHLIKMRMCKIRSVETNRKIKKNDANIVKNEIKKTKFRTKRSRSLKIKTS